MTQAGQQAQVLPAARRKRAAGQASYCIDTRQKKSDSDIPLQGAPDPHQGRVDALGRDAHDRHVLRNGWLSGRGSTESPRTRPVRSGGGVGTRWPGTMSPHSSTRQGRRRGGVNPTAALDTPSSFATCFHVLELLGLRSHLLPERLVRRLPASFDDHRDDPVGVVDVDDRPVGFAQPREGRHPVHDLRLRGVLDEEESRQVIARSGFLGMVASASMRADPVIRTAATTPTVTGRTFMGRPSSP